MRSQQQQRGGFAVGLVVGLLLGLALALAVALYVTKVPVPFINKVPQRTPEQDAAEVERNRNWDPNSALSGKNPARPASAAVAPAQPPVAAVTPTPATPSASVAGGRAPAQASDLPGLFASSPASTRPGFDPFTYFVQAGAYGRTEDAEQQRARLAMLGFSAKVTEREQSGRTVYRVRLGPFEHKDEADAAKSRLEGSGVDAALVRVQK
ncbi:MAG TPA: SPOR domain-containing protein [Ideonella sp.]|nr:SPOR domain-containing protein [Ideonella sp.]